MQSQMIRKKINNNFVFPNTPAQLTLDDIIKYAIKNDYAVTNDVINKKINNNI